jgi:hypothetical protein
MDGGREGGRGRGRLKQFHFINVISGNLIAVNKKAYSLLACDAVWSATNILQTYYVSEEPAVSIFSIEELKRRELSNLENSDIEFLTRSLYFPTRLHGVTFQKTVIFVYHKKFEMFIFSIRNC